MSDAGQTEELEQTLHKRFELQAFRPGQREVIEAVLAGRDVLCVMPTGGGKSLCYQLPALRLQGLTLVVSPLIALMKDQVDGLAARGIQATLINSSLEPAEQYTRLADIEQGRYDLVYVAPERFSSPRFLAAMGRVRLALLAIDEAHCISEWGHDFRPDYARIGLARRRLGSPVCIALTATATDLVRRDIAEQLDLRDPAQFVTGFDRPNLFYRVIDAGRDAAKLDAITSVLEENPGSTIIYTSSRAKAEMVGEFLQATLRKKTVVYHAGLTREQRTAGQERFMTGKAQAVVATNAFGMGVDKADIRSVIHYSFPGTLDAYYQEAGRAGRDGKPAQCVLLYSAADRHIQEMFIENEYPSQDVINSVYEFLRTQKEEPIELTQVEIRAQAGIKPPEQAVGTSLRILVSAGAIERFRARENMAIIRINAEPDDPSLAGRLSPQAHVQRMVVLGLEGLVNRRFGEPVYFHPDQFAGALGMDRAALMRALRNLADELPIDYVPPFRGDAIRMVDRQRRLRDWPIDFAALQRRKDREYEKLDRMIEFAKTQRCRRAYILGYFGDKTVSRCGHCDNCGATALPAAETSEAPEALAPGELVLKILSGVARAKGRFGKTIVAAMLVGSRSEKLARSGLTDLTTYGILKAAGLKGSDVVALLDALAGVGLVENEEVERFRPVIRLTQQGWDYLRDRPPEELKLSLPAPLTWKFYREGAPAPVVSGAPGALVRAEDEDDLATSRLPTSAAGVSTPDANSVGTRQPEPRRVATDQPLRERLRELRTEWARQAAQPAYCVFSNETLDLLVTERPKTPLALSRIKGLGPARLERYGATLLEAIRNCGTDPEPVIVPTPEPISRPDRSPNGLPAPASVPLAPELLEEVPTQEWTVRLLLRGFSAADAAAIRGLGLETIVEHALWGANQGRPVPLWAFLKRDQLDTWKAWRAKHGDVPPPDAEGPLQRVWSLFLACEPARSGV